MATVATQPLRTEPEEERVLIDGVSWDAYEQILDALGDTHTRLTYDSGTLEIMSPSPEHDIYSRVLFMIFHVLSEECGVIIKSLGSTTFKRKIKEKGLEPDECFYMANWPRIRGKKRLNLDVDPPPDLAVEIEVTCSMMNRRAIYAGLGVPEVWRFDGETIEVLLLGQDGTYAPAERSPNFAAIPVGGIAPFLGKSLDLDDHAWVREFRAWVREQLGRPA